MTKKYTHSISYQLSLQLVAEVRPAIERIARRDRDLAKQLTRAATSVALNVAEGWAQPGANPADAGERERSVPTALTRSALRSVACVKSAPASTSHWASAGSVNPSQRSCLNWLGALLYGATR
jgi:hypothetical protein